MSEPVRLEVTIVRPIGIFQGISMEDLSDLTNYPKDAYQHTEISKTFKKAKDGTFCSVEFQRGKPCCVYLADMDSSGELHNFRISSDWWLYW